VSPSFLPPADPQDDPLDALLHESLESCADLSVALIRLRSSLQDIRTGRQDGRSVSELDTAHHRATWHAFQGALGELRSVLADARSEVLRAFVDDEGNTIREAADRTGHSRQRVAFLLTQARSARQLSA
jgi:hypothetical protein